MNPYSAYLLLLSLLHYAVNSGTGKTTTVLALARELYGPELYRSRILELNASDDRGISVVREKIKTFAQASVGTQKAVYVHLSVFNR